MSKRRGPSYTQAEVLHLLTIVREHLPIGQDEWEGVCQEHILAWPNCGRDYLSIRRKFNQLANKHMPTGETVCPPEVREAKEISALITEKADIEIFEDDEEPFVFGFSKSSDESASLPRTVTTSTKSGDTEVDSVILQ